MSNTSSLLFVGFVFIFIPTFVKMCKELLKLNEIVNKLSGAYVLVEHDVLYYGITELPVDIFKMVSDVYQNCLTINQQVKSSLKRSLFFTIATGLWLQVPVIFSYKTGIHVVHPNFTTLYAVVQILIPLVSILFVLRMWIVSQRAVMRLSVLSTECRAEKDPYSSPKL